MVVDTRLQALRSWGCDSLKVINDHEMASFVGHFLRSQQKAALPSGPTTERFSLPTQQLFI
jgi:hypothetical protein